MTKETTLTDDAIHNLIVDLEIECDCGIEATPVDNIVSFARAIEQAVLQSPEVQALEQDPITADNRKAENQACNVLVGLGYAWDGKDWILVRPTQEPSDEEMIENQAEHEPNDGCDGGGCVI